MTELGKLRAKYAALLETHSELNKTCRESAKARAYAEGERDEAREQRDGVRRELAELISARALLVDQVRRTKRQRWIFAGVGTATGAILALTVAILVLKP